MRNNLVAVVFIIFQINYFMNSESTTIDKCENPSITKASGDLLNRNEIFCSGDLIFEDNFDTFNLETWQHENTLAGGGNWEFQWYTNNRSNSFVEDGILHIRPTLTSEVLDEAFLSSGRLNIDGDSPVDECTNPSQWGCERIGTPTNILNPIRSARIRTLYSFSFKYGILKVRAKLPAGDWLWPAIWLLPRRNAYGSWPSSGEIDLVEGRGNRNLKKDGIQIGSEQVSSALHFGPYRLANAFYTTHFKRNSPSGEGYDKNFHEYTLEWTPENITFKVNEEEIGYVEVGKGFWNIGGFDRNPSLDNPWKGGLPVAPFDQEFYIIISLAIGGSPFFPDDAENPDGKPWKNSSPTAIRDFWNARDNWLPTWNLNDKNNTDSSLLVDYVKVYAL